uniref:Uncharacterized protein n=1 Tax=Panagrolaimus sp. ES5 TaxID=591445 RepID=A0AC34GMI2_9BILA
MVVPAADPPAIDQNAIAAIVAAVMAQVNVTPAPPQSSSGSGSLPVLPQYCYDAAKSNGAALWFTRIENLFQLHNITEGKQKVSLTVNALDSSTFEKVNRALIPTSILGYENFDKL